MEWTVQDLGSLGELVGSLAVLVTLVYLAQQVRQSNRLAIAASYQARTDSNIELISILLGSPGGPMAVSTAIENGPLNREQRAFTDWFFEANFVYYENNHFQHKLGLVDLEHWQATQNSIKRVLTMGAARDYWANNSHTYRDSFRIRVDEILKSMVL